MPSLDATLYIRDAAPIDTKGEKSRLVLILIGSTILVVIVVCLLIQPLRRIHLQMQERHLANVSDTEACPEDPHTHSHTDMDANVRAQQIVEQMQQTRSVIPIINTLPVLPMHGTGTGTPTSTSTSTPTPSVGPYGPYPSHSAWTSLPPTPEEPLSPRSSVASLKLKSALRHSYREEGEGKTGGQCCRGAAFDGPGECTCGSARGKDEKRSGGEKDVMW